MYTPKRDRTADTAVETGFAVLCGTGFDPLITCGRGLDPLMTCGTGLDPLMTCGRGLEPLITWEVGAVWAGKLSERVDRRANDTMYQADLFIFSVSPKRHVRMHERTPELPVGNEEGTVRFAQNGAFSSRLSAQSISTEVTKAACALRTRHFAEG